MASNTVRLRFFDENYRSPRRDKSASLPLTEPYWDGINIYRWETAFLQDDPH